MLNHFDLLAKIYDRVMGQPDRQAVAEMLKLPIEGWLLDAGGGTGRVSSLIRDMAGHVVVTDLSVQMLNQAKQKFGLKPVQAHAECLPFPDEFFDRIIVVDSFHHFCNQKLAIKELLRVLKPLGRFVIEEPDIRLPIVKLVALAEKLALMRSHFYTVEKIQKMIAAHGVFSSIETDGKFSIRIIVDKL